MAQIIVVEPKPRLCETLLSLSEQTYRCTPEGTEVVSSLNCLEGWPFPYRRPWIVCGGTRPPQIPDPQWFTDSCVPWLDACLQWLALETEWAMLSFFTSFHTNYLVLVTSEESHHRRLLDSDTLKVVESYSSESALRNATFTHDGEEGMFALELAQERGEVAYLLCHFEENERWCQPLLDRLEKVTSWGAPYKSRYELFRVTDEPAFKGLWKKTGEDYAVAAGVFASDLDVEALQRVTAQSYGLSDEVLGTASWALRVVYGGGSDEHHAHFRAADGRVAERVWEMVLGSSNPGTKPLGRF